MSLEHLLRHRAALRTLITPLSASSTLRESLHTCSSRLFRPSSISKAVSLRGALRCQSTAAAKARKQDFVYPEYLNVFRAGTLRTLSVGGMRIVTLVLFVVGAGLYAPSFYFSADHSSWWVPAFMIASAVPLVVVTLTSGPVVHAIRVRLPTRARRSKDELKHFASNVPLDTVLEVHCIRLWPMPRPKEVVFSDLRRIRPSLKVGLSNLEHVPAIAKANEGKLSVWLIHRWLGRFYVERAQRKDKSAAPGLWDQMWRQIPEAGTEAKPIRRPGRPVAMANRPARSTQRHTIQPQRPARTAR